MVTSWQIATSFFFIDIVGFYTITTSIIMLSNHVTKCKNGLSIPAAVDTIVELPEEQVFCYFDESQWIHTDQEAQF